MNRRSRVLETHRIVRVALAVAGAFALGSLAWAGVILARGGSWWGPLHTFLVGTVLAAISGTAQMFTVTWSSAPPPPRRTVILQGLLLVTGTILVLVGVSTSTGPVTWLGAVSVASSLGLLATILVRIVRGSLLRRFDLSSRFYLLAMVSGAVGVTLGAMMGGDIGPEAYSRLRLVHLHLNLVGLVGFTILGTLPTLLPTFAHHRMVSGPEANVARRLCVGSAGLMAAGLFAPAWVVGLGVLLAAVAAVVLTSGILARLRGSWRRGETLPYIQVVSGVAWLTLWGFVDAVTLIMGEPLGAFAGWTGAAIVAGIGQVLAGSLAYLVPVVLGPPIGSNLRLLGNHPTIPLMAANLAGVLLATGNPEIALAPGVVWLLDFARRLAMLRRPDGGQAAHDGA